MEFNIITISKHEINWNEIPNRIKLAIKNDIYSDRDDYKSIKKLLKSIVPDLKSKAEYQKFALENELFPVDPLEKFGTKFRGWMDFLGLVSIFYETKEQCKSVLKNLVRGNHCLFMDTIMSIDSEQILRIAHDLDCQIPQIEFIAECYQCKVNFIVDIVELKKLIKRSPNPFK